MGFSKKILTNFLKRYFSIYSKSDWEWTLDDPFINKNNTKWMVLKEKYIPINIDRNKVWFRLKRNLNKNW